MFSARIGFMRPDSTSAGASWTPSDITSANMLAWFDATDPTDIIVDALGQVPELLDKSGNGVKMVQAELSRQGKPADLADISTVEFDGMDDYYTAVNTGANLTPFTINSGYGIFTVAKVFKDPSEPQQMININKSTSPNSTASVNQAMIATHEYQQFVRATNSSAQAFVRSGSQPVELALKYHGFTANNPTNGWYNVYNGDVIRKTYTGGGGLTSSPFDRLVIGGMVRGYHPTNGADFFSNFTKMNWNKTLLFDNNLSDDERQKLEGWAAHQLGLTDNLPVDHPYKTTAPEK